MSPLIRELMLGEGDSADDGDGDGTSTCTESDSAEDLDVNVSQPKVISKICLCALVAGLASTVAAGVWILGDRWGSPRIDGNSTVYPVRLLLIRHGYSCTNALSAAGCADPNVPMLHLSEAEQEDLFNALDDVATNFPAPKLLPPLNRSFGIQGRGLAYVGGDPPRPDGFRGDDCMLHVTPWTFEEQWHEMGNVIQMRHFYRDPTLTKCAEFQSFKAGEAFRAWLKHEGIKLDFLGASMLTRTFQTAYHQLLADKTDWSEIFVAEMLEGNGAPLVSKMPFVNEYNPKWGYQADDFAWPRDVQRKNLADAIGELGMRHLDYTHLQDFTREEQLATDWERFKEEMLGKRLLQFIWGRKTGISPFSDNASVRNGNTFERDEWASTAKAATGATGTLQPVLNIGLVSHRGVIHDVCNYATRIANNNAAVEMLLLLEVKGDGSEVIVRQQSGTCEVVMDSPPQHKDMVRRDVANCRNPFDVTLAFPEAAPDGSGLTRCQAAAAADGAYPTRPASVFA